MARKKAIESMVSELLENKLEIELHKRLRKARKARSKERQKTKDQMLELKALPSPADPNVIDVQGEEVEAKDTPETEEQAPCP
jgi:hypothetical protein